jgi:hypothetical protein
MFIKMSIVLTNYILDNVDICISKFTNKNNFKNYFFSPNISIKLYNPKITWIENNNISFSFQKYATIENNVIIKNDNISFLELLRNINIKLLKVFYDYKENYGHNHNKDLPSLFYEKDQYFYIKCNLPNKNGKYFIKTQNGEFIKPKIGTEFTSVILDIRNIWEINGKVGFRLELKEID